MECLDKIQTCRATPPYDNQTVTGTAQNSILKRCTVYNMIRWRVRLDAIIKRKLIIIAYSISQRIPSKRLRI